MILLAAASLLALVLFLLLRQGPASEEQNGASGLRPDLRQPIAPDGAFQGVRRPSEAIEPRKRLPSEPQRDRP